jgi:hypothetical protein
MEDAGCPGIATSMFASGFRTAKVEQSPWPVSPVHHRQNKYLCNKYRRIHDVHENNHSGDLRHGRHGPLSYVVEHSVRDPQRWKTLVPAGPSPPPRPLRSFP